MLAAALALLKKGSRDGPSENTQEARRKEHGVLMRDRSTEDRHRQT